MVWWADGRRWLYLWDPKLCDFGVLANFRFGYVAFWLVLGVLLGGGFKHFLFSPLFGEKIPI